MPFWHTFTRIAVEVVYQLQEVLKGRRAPSRIQGQMEVFMMFWAQFNLRIASLIGNAVPPKLPELAPSPPSVASSHT